MKPPPGALYIHSASELYNEEQVLSKERVVDNWLDKFGMERHQMHYSGHAKGKDLFEIVKTIDAISNSYTEYPEMYVGVITTRNMTVVDEGKTYLISQFKQMAPFYPTATFFKSFKSQGIWSLCTSQSNLGYSLH